MTDIWQDPPKNSSAGGTLWKLKSTDEIDSVQDLNYVYHVGFETYEVSNWPFASKCESRFSNAFIKFDIPTVQSSEITYVGLTLNAVNAGMLLNNPDEFSVHYIDVFVNTLTSGNRFPFAALTENDSSYYGWTVAGQWENTFDVWSEVQNGPYWLPFFDVTSGFKYAVDHDIPFAVRLYPKYSAPYTWDYDSWTVKEECWVAFCGATISFEDWVEMPEGYPQSFGLPVPLLRIETTIPVSGVEYSETISCICSDYKSHAALIGTTLGSLWVTWNYGQNWAKIYEVASGVV